jgi:hypothetical protein
VTPPVPTSTALPLSPWPFAAVLLAVLAGMLREARRPPAF